MPLDARDFGAEESPNSTQACGDDWSQASPARLGSAAALATRAWLGARAVPARLFGENSDAIGLQLPGNALGFAPPSAKCPNAPCCHANSATLSSGSGETRVSSVRSVVGRARAQRIRRRQIMFDHGHAADRQPLSQRVGVTAAHDDRRARGETTPRASTTRSARPACASVTRSRWRHQCCPESRPNRRARAAARRYAAPVTPTSTVYRGRCSHR